LLGGVGGAAFGLILAVRLHRFVFTKH
jgi:hypothetical protein